PLAPVNEHFILGIQAGHSSAARQGIEDIILIGREFQIKSRAALPGSRHLGSPGEAAKCQRCARPWWSTTPGRRILTDHENAICAGLQQSDNDALPPWLEDLLLDRVGLTDRFLGLRKT